MEIAGESKLQGRWKSRQQNFAAIVHGVTKGDNGNACGYLDENGETNPDLDIRNAGQYTQEQLAVAVTDEEIQEQLAEFELEEVVPAKLHTHMMLCLSCDAALGKVFLRPKIIDHGGRSEEEIKEEEVNESEFEKMIPKLQTHTIHCPYCHDHITKVRIVRYQIKPGRVVEQLNPIDLPGGTSEVTEDEIEEEQETRPQSTTQVKPINLLGCLSCFNFFTSTGNCFNIMFGVFRKEPNVPRRHPTREEKSRPEDSSVTGIVQSQSGDEIIIDIPPPTQGPTRQDSTSFEILKSVVYGGLMEVIASLSVVASAAATDATTLTIIALALANLIGGVFIISHNLWDLRDDCYKFSSQETHNRYKELLGQVKHFQLHLFFAILSFLVFGIIPPVTYGYSFHEANDKDFTIVVVAAASFVCVGLLAIFKAYINRCTGFLGYVKTITYYLTTAVSVSGVSYASRNLVTRLVKELRLFETTSGVAVSLVSQAVSMNPSLAYY